MKITANILRFVMCFLSTLLLGCAEKETQVEVSSVSLNTPTIEMVEGETFSLVATILPKDAEYDGVTWASSNASVASVNSGTVTAVMEGTATITASAGGKSATCNVKVSAKIVAVTSITLDKTSLSMQVGDTETLTATIKPEDATDKTIVWTSSDEAVVSVSNGKITALKSGKATITAKSGTCSADCVVTISVNTESIILDKTTLSLAVGESAILTATVKPDDATDKTVTWSSSDESVVKVDNGKVTALKSGKTTITAKCGGKTAECSVTVTVPASSVTLDKTYLSLSVGETAQLTATVKPDDATDKTVVWSSSDESIAKVDNGKVTALKIGFATVTATAASFSVSCKVTVIHPDNIIYYTSTDGNIVKPFNESTFGANIISNEYSNGLGKIIFDSPVLVIGKTAFLECDKIISVQIPETVSVIGDNAFNGCKNMNSINTPKGLSSIGEGAFQGCENLLTYSLPKNITRIEDKTFEYCRKLVLEIPLTVKVIGARAFSNGYNNKKLIIPEGLTSIGYAAFEGCLNIEEIYLPSSVTELGGFDFSNTNIEKIVIPGGVKTIPRGTFSLCQNLLEVVIEEGCTRVDIDVFYYCKHLKTVSFPSTLQTIYCVFYDCIALSDLYIGAITPPYLSKGAFDKNKGLNIWVPRASVEAYKEKWSAYKDNIKGYDF